MREYPTTVPTERNPQRQIMLPRHLRDVQERVDFMVKTDQDAGGPAARHLTRSLMRGGKEAAHALLGAVAKDLQGLPAANLLASHNTRIAQKTSMYPDHQVPLPKARDDAGARARNRAAKRARIVASYDERAGMSLAHMQAARWLPGYQYLAYLVVDGLTPGGFIYPRKELRDPYGTVITDWGVGQQPPDVLFKRNTGGKNLEKVFPHMKAPSAAGDMAAAGAMEQHQGQWEAPGGHGVNWVEYVDEHGRWLIIPDRKLLLDFIPNVVKSGPQFRVFRAPTFDAPVGAHAHTIGLLHAYATQELLRDKAMTEGVASNELYVDGEVISNDGNILRGGLNINQLATGTTIHRSPLRDLPYQAFEHVSRTIDGIRVMLNYPVSDDGKSQLAYGTGAGFEKLDASTAREAAELSRVFEAGYAELDAICLEFDECTDPDVTKPLVGELKGTPFEETYTPGKDIAGAYTVKRKYGRLAGLDEPQKWAILGSAVATGMGDQYWALTEIHGEEEAAAMIARVQADDARGMLIEAVVTGAPIPPKSVELLLAYLPDGEEKERFKAALLPTEEELAAAQQPPVPTGPPPDIFTAMEQATAMSQVGGQGGDVSLRSVQAV